MMSVRNLALRPTTRRRRSAAIIAATVIATLAIAPARVDAAPAPVDPNSAYAALTAIIGVQGLKNQNDLDDFKSWLNQLPHIVDQGFYSPEWT
jgi:hypothetical protein